MVDPFTIARVTRMIAAFKTTHGRDISEGELQAQGIESQTIDYLVKKSVVDKYQVTTGRGTRENRFKIHRDWRSLKEP